MVHCEIHVDYLVVDCFSSDVDYVLEQLDGIPHHVLEHDGRIYAVVVNEDYVFDALLELAEVEDVEVV